METTNRYAKKAPTRGGARPGAGRKKGSSPRFTIEELMSTFETKAGISFSEQVMDNYINAVQRSDWTGVRDYDKMLLAKLVADKSEVEVTDSEDTVAAKAAAFQAALSNLAQSAKRAK